VFARRRMASAWLVVAWSLLSGLMCGFTSRFAWSPFFGNARQSGLQEVGGKFSYSETVGRHNVAQKGGA
jgi:hypothetical protein